GVAEDSKGLSGGDSDGEPPVPIPNTEVKPVSADGTWGATPWESRSPPDIKLREAATPFSGWRPFCHMATGVEMAPKDDKRRRGGKPRDGRHRDQGKRDQDRRREPSGRRDDGGRRQRRSITAVPAGELPRWVREEITRTAPKARREPALTHLARAVGEYADGRFAAAYDQLKRAKQLAPQAATVRELLGLSAYNLEKWEEALRELRTFRRISGETTQVPVEIDCLRALGRHDDAAKTFRQLRDLDPHPATDDEARVVFASHLLDRGEVAEAWRVIKPGRL